MVETFLIVHQFHTRIVFYLQQCKRCSRSGQKRKCCSQFLQHQIKGGSIIYSQLETRINKLNNFNTRPSCCLTYPYHSRAGEMACLQTQSHQSPDKAQNSVRVLCKLNSSLWSLLGPPEFAMGLVWVLQAEQSLLKLIQSDAPVPTRDLCAVWYSRCSQFLAIISSKLKSQEYKQVLTARQPNQTIQQMQFDYSSFHFFSPISHPLSFSLIN